MNVVIDGEKDFGIVQIDDFDSLGTVHVIMTGQVKTTTYSDPNSDGNIIITE